MSAVDPQKKAIVQELLSRRASLSPEKAAVVDELATRFGLNGADFADVQGGSSTAQQSPSAGGAISRMIGHDAGELFGLGKGAAKGIGDFVQTGGQWMENIAGMPVSPPRATATGRDVFQANSPAEQAGKIIGQGAIGLAAPSNLPAQVATGGLVGALMSPDNPYPAAAAGMGVPIAAKAVPYVKALVSGREAGAEKFGQIAAARNGKPTDLSGAANALIEADLAGKTGGNPPKVVKDLFKWQGPMDYETSRRFANRAGVLTASEKMDMDPAMGTAVKKLYGALKDANRASAAESGMADVYDEAMRLYRIGSKGADMKDALIKALTDKWVRVGLGTGAAAYAAKKILD